MRVSRLGALSTAWSVTRRETVQWGRMDDGDNCSVAAHFGVRVPLALAANVDFRTHVTLEGGLREHRGGRWDKN